MKLGAVAAIFVFIASAIGLKHVLPSLIFMITPPSVDAADTDAFISAVRSAIWFKPLTYGLAALFAGFVFALLIKSKSLLEPGVFAVALALLCGVEGVRLLESVLIGGAVLGLFILGAHASRVTVPNHSLKADHPDGRRP